MTLRKYRKLDKQRKYNDKYNDKYYSKVIDTSNRNKPYTSDEDAIILFSRKSDTEIATKLKRSIMSIQIRRSKLKKRENLSFNRLELGNTAFNSNSNQCYVCPEWIIALLRDIDYVLYTVMRNITQQDYDSPFENTANEFNELNKLFKVQAYNWNKDVHQAYNFIWKAKEYGLPEDIKISWYKYLGRDTTINIYVNHSNTFTILRLYEDSIRALRDYEKLKLGETDD